MDEITTASGEQPQGLGQITQAMTQMDTVTQASAATAEKSASAAHELSAQSTELQVAVEQLNALTRILAKTSHIPSDKPLDEAQPIMSKSARKLKHGKLGVAPELTVEADEEFFR